jgi:chaperonin cofactor prefoldin
MDQELVQYLDERFNGLVHGLDQRFEQIDRRFEGIDRRFDEVNDRIEEVKRHSGVLVEDLRYQVRLVAEGFATFVEGRYAQDQARIDERFNETQALLRTSFEHLTRQDDQLRQRVENLERNRPN